MRILLVEDEKKLASFIRRGLEEEHYAIGSGGGWRESAYDGANQSLRPHCS